jgi:hypothetical protein
LAKNVLGNIWAIFSQTHLVTLMLNHFLLLSDQIILSGRIILRQRKVTETVKKQEQTWVARRYIFIPKPPILGGLVKL